MTTSEERGRDTRAVGPPVDDEGLLIVDLSDPDAVEPSLTGAKAAALAKMRATGFAALPGFVLTTELTGRIDAGLSLDAVADQLRGQLRRIHGMSAPGVVVRSSSVAEDSADESMAGQFATVTGVVGWSAFVDAVGVVLDSRARVAERQGRDGEVPIAVLVQPMCEVSEGGVMFGVDPVTGREDRLSVSVVRGSPEPLVSGATTATQYLLDERGRAVSVERAPSQPRLGRRQRRALVRAARRLEDLFGGPQDVEWGWSARKLVLFQSRPVTTEIAGRPVGPVLGPGPVAETFPDPLRPLEVELWIEPLARAVRTAMTLTGVAGQQELDRSPVVTTIDGRAVVDLELFGEARPRRSIGQALAHRVRRISASWRVGRLRTALPALARTEVDDVDALLGAVPPLRQLTERQLLALVQRSREALASVHGHEILIGSVVDPAATALTGASVALRVLVEARGDGLTDDEIIARHPVVLALTPPAVGRPPSLPRAPAPAGWVPDHSARAAVLREALRLRVRWLQELTARAVWSLAVRLEDEGRIPRADAVLGWTLETLHEVAVSGADPPAAAGAGSTAPEGDSLPARFRLSDRGRPVPLSRRSAERGGVGASGGRGTGVVTHDASSPPSGSVLVVEHLEPALAAVLPQLSGLVSETGSVLAHVAIVAREQGVPTVVAHGAARACFPEGSTVEVDGDSGDVTMRT
jgi:phosphohistidine swiveling domain-containing protein